MKKILLLIMLLALLTGCTQPPEPTEATTPTQPVTIPATQPPTEPPDPIKEQVEAMTTEEKVGQLFLARYDGANALTHTQQYHLGGWVLFSGDFQNETPDSIREVTRKVMADKPATLTERRQKIPVRGISRVVLH